MENLIFDRTKVDADYAEANPKSTDFLKGSYNYTDLNRIEEWCKYLADRLNSYSYPLNIITKTDWTTFDFPTKSEMERIRSNLVALKNAYFSFTTLPANAEKMTYIKANEFERNLYDIDFILRHMENNFIYSGVSNCGQNRVWQQRFRRIYKYLRIRAWEELNQVYWNEFDEIDIWEEVPLIATNHEL